MKTYKLTIGYDGKPFCGFARQSEVITVQGELERALSTLLRSQVDTVCAGRTDRGVHAKEQVVSLTTNSKEQLSLRSLSALVGDSIAITKIEEVDSDFSARFSAKWREYRYFIFNSESSPIFAKDFCWHVKKPLDTTLMTQACKYIVGEHDFKSFCLAVSAKDKTTVREVYSVEIAHDNIMGEELICIRVIGNAFLHSMIRAIVGTLVDVGKGKRSPESIHKVIEARDRRAAGENAPAKGLVFWHVEY